MTVRVLQHNNETWVKICGINDPSLLQEICAIKPDALGFNFFEKSIRYVSPQMAKELVSTLPTSILPVGLFVNHQVDEIRKICLLTGIMTIQLHGDESPEMMLMLQEFSIIRAVRISSGMGLKELFEEHQRLQDVGVTPIAYLVDKRSTKGYGGTGETLPWELLRQEYDQTNMPPLILAGGLTPQNVRQAISIVQPYGVDVASGVESAPGVKAIDACRNFVVEARR